MSALRSAAYSDSGRRRLARAKEEEKSPLCKSAILFLSFWLFSRSPNLLANQATSHFRRKKRGGEGEGGYFFPVSIKASVRTTGRLPPSLRNLRFCLSGCDSRQLQRSDLTSSSPLFAQPSIGGGPLLLLPLIRTGYSSSVVRTHVNARVGNNIWLSEEESAFPEGRPHADFSKKIFFKITKSFYISSPCKPFPFLHPPSPPIVVVVGSDGSN